MYLCKKCFLLENFDIREFVIVGVKFKGAGMMVFQKGVEDMRQTPHLLLA